MNAVWNWFTGLSEYEPTIECMKRDWRWIIIVLCLNVGVIASYAVITLQWYRAKRGSVETKSKQALNDLIIVFIFCGLCGYGLTTLRFFVPVWKLTAVLLAVLNFYAWRYALRASNIKILYQELESGRRLGQQVKEVVDNVVPEKLTDKNEIIVLLNRIRGAAEKCCVSVDETIVAFDNKKMRSSSSNDNVPKNR